MVDRLDTHGREPVGPLPAVLGAIDGAARLQGLVERTAAEAARHRALLARIAHLVVMRVVPDGPRVHEGARAVEEAEPPDVERPEDARSEERRGGKGWVRRGKAREWEES